MPAIDLDRSLLLDAGLQALKANAATPASLTSDMVGTFKGVVLGDQVRLTDPALRTAIAEAQQPVDLATVFISGKQDDAGKLGLDLGPAAGAVAALPGGGFTRAFGNADVVWHGLFGAHILHGAIAVKWRELGGAGGFLGYPTSDILPGQDPRGEGQFAHFAGGSIFYKPLPTPITTVAAALAAVAPVDGEAESGQVWRPEAAIRVGDRRVTPLPSLVAGAVVKLQTSAGAFEVHGAIRDKYLALGAEASILGYPRTDETGTPDGVGRYNHFEGGSIYWTPATAAHEVHGLIRERWAALGWERNSQLGYPLSDELIPDRRIGHRHPEARKKPLTALPGDIVKLPAEALDAGFPTHAVNVASAAAKAVGASPDAAARVVDAVRPSAAVAATAAGGSTLVGLDVSKELRPVIAQPGLLFLDPASTPGPVDSKNRFCDFQNGVLFWFRGQAAATTLTPVSKMSDGTDVSLSGADLAKAVLAKMGTAPFAASPMNAVSLTYVGVTDYSHDGAQTHNRRHRLQLTLGGVDSSSSHGPFGIPIPSVHSLSASVELLVEVSFEAGRRAIVFMPVEWSILHATPAEAHFKANLALHAKLDPLLWTRFDLVELPDTNDGAPIAVLSVKTLPNGNVAVFTEPTGLILHLVSDTLLDAVTPTTIPIAPKP